MSTFPKRVLVLRTWSLTRTFFERLIIHGMDQEIGKMSVWVLSRVIQTSWDILVQLSQPDTPWNLSSRDPSRLRKSEFTQNFWVFSVNIADFWQTFWVIWENGSSWSNLRLKMSVSALGRLKNHNVPHLHPNFTMFMPLNRLQLKICAFSGKFNVCSKWVLLSWIEIYRDFTLQTQIFTQKYRSWLRFYSEFLRKNLAAGVSVLNSSPT